MHFNLRKIWKLKLPMLQIHKFILGTTVPKIRRREGIGQRNTKKAIQKWVTQDSYSIRLSSRQLRHSRMIMHPREWVHISQPRLRHHGSDQNQKRIRIRWCFPEQKEKRREMTWADRRNKLWKDSLTFRNPMGRPTWIRQISQALLRKISRAGWKT